MDNFQKSVIESEIEKFIRTDNPNSKDDEAIDYCENLFTSGLLDSIGIMRLIVHLQTKYEYKIPSTDLIPENFKTIRIMANYLALQLENRKSANDYS